MAAEQLEKDRALLEVAPGATPEQIIKQYGAKIQALQLQESGDLFNAKDLLQAKKRLLAAAPKIDDSLPDEKFSKRANASGGAGSPIPPLKEKTKEHKQGITQFFDISPLYQAFINKDYNQAVQLLGALNIATRTAAVQKLNQSIKDGNVLTLALEMAVQAQHSGLKLLKLLLAANAGECINTKNRAGMTPVFFAMQSGLKDAAQLLAREPKLNKSALDHEHLTMYSRAILCGYKLPVAKADQLRLHTHTSDDPSQTQLYHAALKIYHFKGDDYDGIEFKRLMELLHFLLENKPFFLPNSHDGSAVAEFEQGHESATINLLCAHTNVDLYHHRLLAHTVIKYLYQHDKPALSKLQAQLSPKEEEDNRVDRQWLLDMIAKPLVAPAKPKLDKKKLKSDEKSAVDDFDPAEHETDAKASLRQLFSRKKPGGVAAGDQEGAEPKTPFAAWEDYRYSLGEDEPDPAEEQRIIRGAVYAAFDYSVRTGNPYAFTASVSLDEINEESFSFPLYSDLLQETLAGSNDEMPTPLTQGLHAIHLAAREGYVDAVRNLLELDLHQAFTQDETRGWTALHYALHHKQTAVIEHFARFTYAVRAKDIRGRTPLHHAALINAAGTEAARTLIEGLIFDAFNEDSADKDGHTPLHLACGPEGNLAVAKLLIKHDLYHGASRDKHGRTAWHLILQYGKVELLTQLVQTKKDSNGLDVPDDKGFLPLHRAAQSGDITSLNLLLEANKRLLEATAVNCTALYYAMQAGHLDAVKMLIAFHGAALDSPAGKDTTPWQLLLTSDNEPLITAVFYAIWQRSGEEFFIHPPAEIRMSTNPTLVRLFQQKKQDVAALSPPKERKDAKQAFFSAAPAPNAIFPTTNLIAYQQLLALLTGDGRERAKSLLLGIFPDAQPKDAPALQTNLLTALELLQKKDVAGFKKHCEFTIPTLNPPALRPKYVQYLMEILSYDFELATGPRQKEILALMSDTFQIGMNMGEDIDGSSLRPTFKTAGIYKLVCAKLLAADTYKEEAANEARAMVLRSLQGALQKDLTLFNHQDIITLITMYVLYGEFEAEHFEELTQFFRFSIFNDAFPEGLGVEEQTEYLVYIMNLCELNDRPEVLAAIFQAAPPAVAEAYVDKTVQRLLANGKFQQLYAFYSSLLAITDDSHPRKKDWKTECESAQIASKSKSVQFPRDDDLPKPLQPQLQSAHAHTPSPRMADFWKFVSDRNVAKREAKEVKSSAASSGDLWFEQQLKMLQAAAGLLAAAAQKSAFEPASPTSSSSTTSSPTKSKFKFKLFNRKDKDPKEKPSPTITSPVSPTSSSSSSSLLSRLKRSPHKAKPRKRQDDSIELELPDLPDLPPELEAVESSAISSSNSSSSSTSPLLAAASSRVSFTQPASPQSSSASESTMTTTDEADERGLTAD